MYLAHGWPRALDLDLPGQPVAAFHDGSVIVLVTSGGLGLWSAGAGGGGGGGGGSSGSSASSSSCSSSSGAPFRLATELAPRGETHVAALWRPSGIVSTGGTATVTAGSGGGGDAFQRRRLPALAVLSSAGVLRIYGVHFSEERRALPVSAPLGGCYSGGGSISDGDGGGSGRGGGGRDGNNAAAATSSSSSSSDPLSLFGGSEDPLTGAGPASVDLYVTEEIDIVGMSSSSSNSSSGGNSGGGGEGEGEGGEGEESNLPGGGVARPAALAGDASCLLVALADGEMLAVTWQGDVKGRARPFDGFFHAGRGSESSSSSFGPLSPSRSPPVVSAVAAAATTTPPPPPPLLSPSLPSPFPSPSAYRSSPLRAANPPPPSTSSPLVALHYCPLARVAAAAFADGRVSLARASATALRPPAALGIPWDVRAGGGGPRARPVAVAVSGAADAVAVGTDLGDVELFSLSAVAAQHQQQQRNGRTSTAATAAFSSPFSSPPLSPASMATTSYNGRGFEEAAPPPQPMRVLSPRGDDDSDDDDEGGNSGGAIATTTATATIRRRRRTRGSGPAAALAWSPCGGAVAVGWARGGLCCASWASPMAAFLASIT